MADPTLVDPAGSTADPGDPGDVRPRRWSAGSGHPADAPFDHFGLLYHDESEYLAGVTSFVRNALDADEPVMVAVPYDNLTLLRAALADEAERVRFADMAVAGRNPGRIIPGVLLAFAAAHPGRRVWIVGEPIWAGRSEIAYPACAAHEALINAVFANRDAAILCPYDARRLDRAALDDAAYTHPVMADGTGAWRSPAYTDGYAAAARFNLPLPPVPPDAAVLVLDGEVELAGVRRFVTAHALAAGLDPERAEDLTLAVNELAANTAEYTPGTGRVGVWVEPGQLVCQIDDHGHLADPLAGRVPPAPEVEGGRGLILANQLCDLVRTHTRPDGTSIRLHIDF